MQVPSWISRAERFAWYETKKVNSILISNKLLQMFIVNNQLFENVTDQWSN